MATMVAPNCDNCKSCFIQIQSMLTPHRASIVAAWRHDRLLSYYQSQQLLWIHMDPTMAAPTHPWTSRAVQAAPTHPNVWWSGATLVAEGQATTTTQKECRRSKQEESITSAKRVGEEQSAIPRFGRHQTTTVPSHSKPLSRFPDSFKKASPFPMRC